MAYEVLARKWRPQQFEDVVGQDHVTRTLSNAIETERVAHAYIFVGSRGTGKTTTARILAKALNCKKGPTPHPCDACDSCREIMSGSSLDVIEIDGASNNGVDQVRDLRDNARYAPARDSYKIYIIDEVHMLSNAAFNALLKTLEEPPEHVKFIFATTDVHKVLPTILSRCQRFDLRRISVQDIVTRLRTGCAEEGIEISEDALLAIARGAEGGLRDAESALDQLISFRGKKIAEEDVLAVFGLVSRHVLEGLVEAIIDSDVPKIIQMIAEMDQAGKDLSRIVMELMEHFRNLLVMCYAKNDIEALELPDGAIDFYESVSKKTDPGRVLRIIDALVDTDLRMRHALSRKTLLETGLVHCSRAAETVTLNELLKQVAELKKNAPHQPERDVALPVEVEKKKNLAPDPEKELQILTSSWRSLVERASKAAPLSRRYLLDTVPLRVEPTHLVVGFDPEFAQERKRFDHSTSRMALARGVEAEIGRLLEIRFELLPAGFTKPLPADHAPDSSPKEKSSQRTGELKWYANPAVKEVVEAFNGEIVDVRE